MNDQTRAWSKRFMAVSPKGTMPSMAVAGNYAAVPHYLKAMEALGGNPHDGAKARADSLSAQYTFEPGIKRTYCSS